MPDEIDPQDDELKEGVVLDLEAAFEEPDELLDDAGLPIVVSDDDDDSDDEDEDEEEEPYDDVETDGIF